MGSIWNAINNPNSVDGARAPNTATTINDILDRYNTYLPASSDATARAGVNATNQTTEGYNATQLAQLQKYGAPLAQAGAATERAAMTGSAQNNQALLTGAGRDAAIAANNFEREVNPSISLAKTKSADLLNSINLNGLSGGERAEVERSLGKSATATGNLGLDNATNAVENAMQYGDRLGQKRQELNQYINTGVNAGSSGINPAAVALGSNSNIGTNGLISTKDSASQNTASNNALLGSVSGIGTALINPQAEANWKNSERYAMDQIGANS